MPDEDDFCEDFCVKRLLSSLACAAPAFASDVRVALFALGARLEVSRRTAHGARATDRDVEPETLALRALPGRFCFLARARCQDLVCWGVREP